MAPGRELGLLEDSLSVTGLLRGFKHGLKLGRRRGFWTCLETVPCWGSVDPAFAYFHGSAQGQRAPLRLALRGTVGMGERRAVLGRFEDSGRRGLHTFPHHRASRALWKYGKPLVWGTSGIADSGYCYGWPRRLTPIYTQHRAMGWFSLERRNCARIGCWRGCDFGCSMLINGGKFAGFRIVGDLGLSGWDI